MQGGWPGWPGWHGVAVRQTGRRYDGYVIVDKVSSVGG